MLRVYRLIRGIAKSQLVLVVYHQSIMHIRVPSCLANHIKEILFILPQYVHLLLVFKIMSERTHTTHITTTFAVLINFAHSLSGSTAASSSIRGAWESTTTPHKICVTPFTVCHRWGGENQEKPKSNISSQVEHRNMIDLTKQKLIAYEFIEWSDRFLLLKSWSWVPTYVVMRRACSENYCFLNIYTNCCAKDCGFHDGVKEGNVESCAKQVFGLWGNHKEKLWLLLVWIAVKRRTRWTVGWFVVFGWEYVFNVVNENCTTNGVNWTPFVLKWVALMWFVGRYIKNICLWLKILFQYKNIDNNCYFHKLLDVINV